MLTLTSLPLMAISCCVKPTEEITSVVAFEGTDMRYVPFASVLVPIFVPLTKTDTPTNGVPSLESLIVPVTTFSCDQAIPDSSRRISKQAALPASNRFNINNFLVCLECVSYTQCNMIFRLPPNFVQEFRPLVKNPPIDLNCNPFSTGSFLRAAPKSKRDAGCKMKRWKKVTHNN